MIHCGIVCRLAEYRAISMPEQHYRYRDLHERKIVPNRPTMQRWIRDYGFPRGVLLGPRHRAWADSEIAEWLEARRKITAPDAKG
jgi:predicted DNA-binding transcriptional regulator AlpA